MEGLGVLRSLAGAFQFSGDDVDKPVRVLSGGEKSRLVLARMLFDPPNFLVLDEPTNHLDLATKEMLVEALHDFEGTMLFVSHDRTFLRGLANRVLEIGGEDGTGKPVTYGGTYEEYVAQQRPRGARRPRVGRRSPCVPGASPVRQVRVFRRGRTLTREQEGARGRSGVADRFRPPVVAVPVDPLGFILIPAFRKLRWRDRAPGPQTLENPALRHSPYSIGAARLRIPAHGRAR